MTKSTHFNDAGDAHMVDVSQKQVTVRRAVAEAVVRMQFETGEMVRNNAAQKGDVLAVARLAGIGATKMTQQLIPLCHAIPVESVTIDFHWIDDSTDQKNTPELCCVATVMTSAKTGVEMEAMTAVSVAALTVYDMVKSVDRGLEIGPIRLREKSGGKSGDFKAS